MIRTAVFAVAVSVAALSAPALALAQPGPLVDKPLPPLDLSHALQGDEWTPASLRGSIVVLDIFQLG